MKHPLILAAVAVVGLLLLLIVVDVLILLFNGKSVSAPSIPRGPEVFGSGPPIAYVVLGDSTSIGQGSDYDQSIARGTARHLAETHTVTLYNFGVSGARAADVQNKQLQQALKVHPDIILVDVSANDVTHLTPPQAVRNSLQQVIKQLRQENADSKIVLTGSPQMGSIPRFPWPLGQLARSRTAAINREVIALAQQTDVTFAPVAGETGPVFDTHPEYFAQDNFHPNAEGYAVWIPTLNRALDAALQK